jgi:AraC-like DNA-binding protein
MRLLQPFLELTRGLIPDSGMRALEAMDPDTRIPACWALKLLDESVRKLKDPDLGLRAARVAAQGDFDLLEYAMVSAPTVREANEILRRYVGLLDDALDYSLEIRGDRAISRLRSHARLPRAAADFQLGTLYNASRRWLPHPPNLFMEIWLSYPEPPDTREHRRTFQGANLRFDAPFEAIVYERGYLDLRPPHSDPKLHALLVKQLEQRVVELPPALTLRHRVRKLIVAELAGGNPSTDHIAGLLGMSRRTLMRQLLAQGIRFQALLDEVRLGLAERALISEDVGIAEIAERLGFAEPAAFRHAFRRWTGTTPTQYRARNWRGPSGPN